MTRITQWTFIVLLFCTFIVPVQAKPSALGIERAKAIEELYHLEDPSIPLSAAYQGIPPEQRHVLMARLKTLLFSQIPPDALSDETLALLPPEVAAQVKILLTLAEATTPEQMDAFLLTQDLDHLMPLPTEAVRLYHEKAWTETATNGIVREIIRKKDRKDPSSWIEEARNAPGYINDSDPAPLELIILGANDAVPSEEVPHDVIEPAFDGLGLKVSRVVKLPAYALVNSQRIAHALNHLTNHKQGTPPLKITIVDQCFTARTPEDLIEGLYASKRYDMVLFDARMFVNFVGMSLPYGDGTVSVRIPTWFYSGVNQSKTQSNIPGIPQTSMIMPSNHSEHLLAIYNSETGNLEGMIKWYMGLPSPEYKQGTLFKSAVWARTSWSGFRVVRIYEKKAKVSLFAGAGSRIMRVINFIQSRYNFRTNGYAVIGVCDDSTGLMEAILCKDKSSVWPLVRDPRLDFYYAAIIDDIGLELSTQEGEQVLNVPSDARPDMYPEIKVQENAIRRLGMNVPTRDLGTLPFPQLVDGLRNLEDNSPIFKKALKHLK